MNEDNLVSAIKAYKEQLSQVEAALDATSEGGSSDDLVKLKHDLQELISLTEESLLSLKKSQLLSLVDQQIANPISTSPAVIQHENGDNKKHLADEMAEFQAAISGEVDDTEQQQQQQNLVSEGHSSDENISDLSEIIGTKCRAPYEHDWGGYSYHNCMIINVECFEDNCEPKVRVMFCQPTHQSMLPCPYFLEDRCRFDDKKCRYSHGYVVDVNMLKEYLEPDYSKLTVDGDCIVKDTDGIWYKAKVTDVKNEGQSYDVLFDSSERTATVDIADIIPCQSGEMTSGSDSEDEASQTNVPLDDADSGEDDQLPVYLWRPNQSTSALGEWENYTKGIGSRLMSKMGYITGQGLGRESQGRVEPVPIQLLPQGKSLDKIMELKEIAGDQDLYDVLKKEKKKQKKMEKAASENYKKNVTRHTVFDFINKKIGHKKGDIHSLVNVTRTNKQSAGGAVRHITEKQLSARTDRQLNVHMLQTQEEITRTEKEISKLKEAVARNKDREPAVAAQMCRKLSNLEGHLSQLQSSQSTIQSHKQSRADKKKLTIF